MKRLKSNMQSHDQLVKKLMIRPGVKAEVNRLECLILQNRIMPPSGQLGINGFRNLR